MLLIIFLLEADDDTMLEQKDLLAGLNEPQKKAVTMTEGPVLILAGPGSGKTRVITHRIAYLVQHENISPWRILAVTFTNKAAKEMRERLEKLVGINESKEMTIGTFHAICARVLRVEADHLAPLGLNRSFVILDTDDQATLIKQAIRSLNLDEKQYRPAAIQGMISRAKNDLLGPEQMAEQAAKYIEEVAARVYKAYQKLLRANNSVDFMTCSCSQSNCGGANRMSCTATRCAGTTSTLTSSRTAISPNIS